VSILYLKEKKYFKMSKVPNITARDFAAILGISPYENAFHLLEQKIEKKHPFFGNKFTEHGNKFENIAIKAFENTKGVLVDDNQFNFKHPDYNWISGRLDGLFAEDVYEKISDTSRKRKRNRVWCVLEIKCPLKEDRKNELTEENIPKHYWSQCQVYMNMTGCRFAYYVEYYIRPDGDENNAKIYYVKIERDDQWWDNALPKVKKYYENEIRKYHKIGNLETHPVRIAEKQWQSTFI